MPGQPENEFDVTRLECVELTGQPNNIIDSGENFILRATFRGSGSNWENMVNIGGLEYVARFFAEGMGWGVPNINLGPVVVQPLVAGLFEYTVNSQMITVNAEGIYRCGVTVTFRVAGGGAPWIGVLGYNEDCVIQINPAEG